jgi:hypothetical protein
MAKATRRGPKKGKRLTSELQSQIVINAIYSKKSLPDVINGYKKDGYNVKKETEDQLMNLGPIEIGFMLANQQILDSLKEEALNIIIKEIPKIKK